MFYLKSKYLLVPPSSSDYKLIFPLNLKKFRYDRGSFSEQKVDEKLTSEQFNLLIDEIERDVLFFRKLIIYKLISIFSLVSLLLFLIIGIVIIGLDAVKNQQRTEDEFARLTGNPNQHLMETKSDELAVLTVIGIVIVTFGIIQFIVILIVINVLSNRTFAKYAYKIAKIFDHHQKNIWKKDEIKMMQGEKSMWLEMRLDYKYKEYLGNHNQTSWEQIVAINNEMISKGSNNNNLLEKKLQIL